MLAYFTLGLPEIQREINPGNLDVALEARKFDWKELTDVGALHMGFLGSAPLRGLCCQRARASLVGTARNPLTNVWH